MLFITGTRRAHPRQGAAHSTPGSQQKAPSATESGGSIRRAEGRGRQAELCGEQQELPGGQGPGQEAPASGRTRTEESHPDICFSILTLNCPVSFIYIGLLLFLMEKQSGLLLFLMLRATVFLLFYFCRLNDFSVTQCANIRRALAMATS